MIVVILEAPENSPPEQRGTDFEIRLMIRNASIDEGEKIGEAIHRLCEEIRPEQELVSFILYPDQVAV